MIISDHQIGANVLLDVDRKVMRIGGQSCPQDVREEPPGEKCAGQEG